MRFVAARTSKRSQLHTITPTNTRSRHISAPRSTSSRQTQAIALKILICYTICTLLKCLQRITAIGGHRFNPLDRPTAGQPLRISLSVRLLVRCVLMAVTNNLCVSTQILVIAIYVCIAVHTHSHQHTRMGVGKCWLSLFSVFAVVFCTIFTIAIVINFYLTLVNFAKFAVKFMANSWWHEICGSRLGTQLLLFKFKMEFMWKFYLKCRSFKVFFGCSEFLIKH